MRFGDGGSGSRLGGGTVGGGAGGAFVCRIAGDHRARARWTGIHAAALRTATIGAVLLAWARLADDATVVLTGCALAFIVSSLCTYFYGLVLPRLLDETNPWLIAARRFAGPLMIVSVASLLATLGAELSLRARWPMLPFHGLAASVLLTLLAGCAISLVSALRPGDPPRLSRRLRLACVYGAELLLAVAILHVRIAEPWLFHHRLAAYWPLVVMAIAFVGVGAAEVLARQGWDILSEPLGRTGIFLPLLPVIGWWVSPAAAVDFSQLLLVVSALYALLAWLRRSLGFAALAALAANGALWDFLARSQTLAFGRHPQLWLIPAALSVLAGAQLNRDRLAAARCARFGMPA